MLRALTFLFCLLLPVGWAKHWIVPSSLVNGVLVDYLMLDIWVQDLIAVTIIVLTVARLRVTGYGFLKLLTRNSITLKLIPVVLILISVILSPVPLISAINLVRFLLAMAVGWIILKNKDLHQSALAGLSGAVIWTAFLAVGQFVNQGTTIGWQFLGEPVFGPGSGGVKKVFLFGQQILVPMATFPHANVMGAFGLLSFIVLKQRFTKYLSLILAVLSFSLPIWLITFYLLSRQFKPSYVVLILSGVLGVIGLWVAGYEFPVTSYYRRVKLIKYSLTMIKNHPFFGVGWGGFVKQLPQATFLQPVHNIYLLVIAELGIVGTSGLLLVIREFLKRIKFRRYWILATIYLLLFMVDHYFWTTTQGIYMLWVMIALF